jgi:hypothetical protein
VTAAASPLRGKEKGKPGMPLRPTLRHVLTALALLCAGPAGEAAAAPISRAAPVVPTLVWTAGALAAGDGVSPG